MTNHEPGGRSPRPDHPVRPLRAAGAEPRASGISEVIAIVPHLLGYRPDHSLVLLTVRPDSTSGHGMVRGRVGFTARIDLPEIGQLHQLTQALARPVHQGVGGEGSEGTVVHAIVYDIPEEEGEPSPAYLQGLTAALEDLCDQLGMWLHDLVLVRPAGGQDLPAAGGLRVAGAPSVAGGSSVAGAPSVAGGSRVQAALEHRPLLRAGEELDLPWTPLPQAADVPATADLVLRGRSALGSRDEVAAGVRHRDEEASAATSLALDVLALSPGRLDEDHALSRLGSWVVRGEPVPSPRDRAWIAVLLHDRGIRDAVLARWVPSMFDLDDIVTPVEAASLRRHVPPWPEETLAPVGRLLTLAAQVPLDLTAPLLTLAGLAAWAHGEGTLALEAGRHALEVDPDYRMALLLDQALATGMRPPGITDPADSWDAEPEGRRGVA